MKPRSARVHRRQKVGRFNRVLGYLVLPLLVVSTAIYYAVGTDSFVQDITHTVLLPLFFLHVALSFYVFGLVRPRRTLRVFHIYFGYLTFFLVMFSQSGDVIRFVFWTDDDDLVSRLRFVFTVLMYVAIAIHIGIGARYGVTRRATDVPRRRFSPSRSQSG